LCKLYIRPVYNLRMWCGPWVDYPWSWKHCLLMLAWNLEEERIPFPPVVSISLIFTTWRKVSTGCNLIHFLLFHISVRCGNRVVPDVPGQYMFQYVHQLVLKHLILSLIINVFHFLLSHCTLCCEITVSSLCKLAYKSDYIIRTYV